MSWVAVAIAGSAVIGAVASNRAGKKQAKSADKALAQNERLVGPYSDAGAAGLPAVQSFVDEGARFSDTRAYKDIINSAKAGGANQSANRITALEDYYATNFRPQRLNELMSLVNTGANASVGQATNASNILLGKGEAQANAIYGVGNSAQNAFNSYAFLQNQKNNQGVFDESQRIG